MLGLNLEVVDKSLNFSICALERRGGMNNLLGQNEYLVYMISDVEQWGGFQGGTYMMGTSTER